ncbi:MAG TPA: amidohydrolase family protein [Candidatus Acidoferrales bacterium]|nr:amidohydrolase family protein [Candidatus Acidoferrales bacterium]
MKIDAHQHFWQYDAQRDGWITDEMSVLKRDFLPSDLLPELSANGIDGTIAVQADQSEREMQFLLELAEQNSAILGVVGWVDLRSPSLADRLEHFAPFEKLCGFRHVVQAEPDDRFMLREDFQRGIGMLADFGFTYDILIYPRQLPAAIELVQKFPKQPFIIDHLAKPEIKGARISEWAGQMRTIAQSPNVYCKVSGIVTEADWRTWRAEEFRPYLDVVFGAFGVDRLIFGSDWPVCLLAGTYSRVKQLIVDYLADFPESDRAKIFGANAVHFYGLWVNA